MKKINVLVSGVLMTIIMLASAPNMAFAQTVTYQPRTQGELLAYLYGRISQLLAIKALVDKGRTLEDAANATSVDLVTNSTYKATEVTDTTAILRGEVTVYGEATANAWFEYGQDEDFLDQRSNQVSIRSLYDRAVRVEVRNLEPDERYYFRIVTMSRDDTVLYGDIYGFYTDESDEE